MITVLVIVNAILLITAVALLVALVTRKPDKMDSEKLMDEVKDIFKAASFDALTRQAAQGAQTLEEKKKLIDQSLAGIQKELDEVQRSVDDFNRSNKSGLDTIAERIQNTNMTASKLAETTENLRKVLSDPSARGQWGEKMAEDVLRMAGFVENINYIKQKVQSTGKKPDFTFLLPKGMKVNMDSKFPFTNYLKYIESSSEADKEQNKKQFINDVKLKIKEVTNRDYINPEENTVDYVILFIPNEQVYTFINDTDRELLDNAMKQKVIVCSPMTLYAVLAVIRQAMDNFNLAAKTNEVFKYVEEFKKQWLAYVESMNKMGRAIEAAQKEYGALSSTRTNQIDRVVNKFDDLKQRKELEQ